MAYRQIHETFWTDPKIRNLKPEEKLLFLYLISNPHSNFSGIYYLPKSLMAEETGLSDRGIDRGIDTLSIDKIVKYDDSLKIVWILKMLKHQSNNFKINDKQITGIINQLNKLHNSLLIKEFLEYHKELNIDFTYTPIDTPIDRSINTSLLTVPDTVPVPVTDICNTTNVKNVKNDIYSQFFDEIWSKYPKRDGKRDALRHFSATVKSDKDVEDIRKALSNYLQSDTVKNGYIKNGSTWFHNWRDWIDNPVDNLKSKKWNEI